MRRFLTLCLIVVIGLLITGCGKENKDKQSVISIPQGPFAFNSVSLGRETHSFAIRKGSNSRGRSLLLLLHGRGNNPETWIDDAQGGFHRFLKKDGPIVILVDGDDHSYYHDRADGDWEKYIVEEIIPRAKKQYGIDDKRIAIGGHSMGGFGALNIALNHPKMFCAVGAHQPALWQHGYETASGAFDNAEDFDRNDVIKKTKSKRHPFGNAMVWIDYGDKDDFVPGDRAFIEAAKQSDVALTKHTWPGKHGMKLVRKHMAEIMNFYLTSLENCER